MKKKLLLMSLSAALAVIPSLLSAQAVDKLKSFSKEVFSDDSNFNRQVLSLENPGENREALTRQDVSPSMETYGERIVRVYKENGWRLPYPEEKMLGFKRVKAPSGVEIAPPEKPLHFTGFLQYSMVNGQMKLVYGMYGFNTSDGLRREKYADVDWCVNMGGVYYNHRLHGYSTIPLPYDGGDGRTHYAEYDADTWHPTERNGLDVVGNGFAMQSYKDADYNPVDGMCYGFTAWGDLDRFDYESNICERVASPGIAAAGFAINSKGEGYVVSDRKLSRVDLSTGELTLIGELDMPVVDVLQSMTFDRETDKLYYAVGVKTGTGSGDLDPGTFFGALLEVDTETARTTVRGVFPEDEEYTVLNYIPQPDAQAPAGITDLAAVYDGDSCEGSVSFTMPTATFSGDVLTEAEYCITLNDAEETAI